MLSLFLQNRSANRVRFSLFSIFSFVGSHKKAPQARSHRNDISVIEGVRGRCPDKWSVTTLTLLAQTVWRVFGQVGAGKMGIHLPCLAVRTFRG